jgi:glycosyltransferase involved in cell wall biosynthesis
MASCIFITSQYPLNYGDTAFIKSEIPFTAKVFDRIYVVCLGKRNKNDTPVEVPPNVSVDFYQPRFSKIRKLVYLAFFGIPVFLDELAFLSAKKKLSVNTLYTAAAFLGEALLFKSYMRRRLRDDRNIALVYSYWYYSATMGALLAANPFGRATGHMDLIYSKSMCPCVTRTHGFDLYEFRNRQNYQPYKVWMDKRIARVFFISKHGHNYYRAAFAASGTEKYSLSRLGIINSYSPPSQSNGAFMLLSCSNLIPLKRVHLIIHALTETGDCVIHWTHIGHGPDSEALVSLAHDLLDGKKNISYEFKGFMTNDEVMRFYSGHYFDCFISASESEGLPVSMMEAISFGIPVIATDVGGVPELVNGDTGILLDPDGGVPALQKAINDFYNFPPERKNAMRKAARLLWETEFNAEANYTKFAGELRQILREIRQK